MKAKARRIGREHKTKDVERAWVRFAKNLADVLRLDVREPEASYGPPPQEHRALVSWRQDLKEWRSEGLRTHRRLMYGWFAKNKGVGQTHAPMALIVSDWLGNPLFSVLFPKFDSV